MNVVDSSAWLEYFGDGPNATEFAGAIEDPDHLVAPTLTLFEVFKRTSQIADETAALDAVAVMMQGTVVEFTASLSLATARSSEAVLWTQDAHFDGMDGVEYRAKR